MFIWLFFQPSLAVNVLYEEVIDFMHIQLFTRIIYVYRVSLPRFDHELLDSWYTKFQTINRVDT